MSFAERLIMLRQSRGITQRQLAAGIGVSEIAIQNYENSRRKPTFDILIALADYYDISLDYLVGRSDDPQRRI